MIVSASVSFFLQQEMEQFLEKKAEMFFRLRKFQEDVDNNDLNLDQYSDLVDLLSDEYNELIHQTWKALMKLEMTLYEQLEEAVQTFDHTLTEMVNTFVENAQGYFTQMRSLEQTYMENIAEIANRFLTNLNIQDNSVCPEELAEVDRQLYQFIFIFNSFLYCRLWLIKNR